MELWQPPHDEPHLLEWWRSLVLASKRARDEHIYWPIHLDEFRLVGRVPRKGRPDIWIYEHHANQGPLYVDATGQTYDFIPTPRAKGPGMHKQCEIRTAIWRARLPDVVEPVWYDEPPLRQWDDDYYEPYEEPEPPPDPRRPTRHAHLSVIDGTADTG